MSEKESKKVRNSVTSYLYTYFLILFVFHYISDTASTWCPLQAMLFRNLVSLFER